MWVGVFIWWHIDFAERFAVVAKWLTSDFVFSQMADLLGFSLIGSVIDWQSVAKWLDSVQLTG